jgi:perosamine synthetase
MPDALSSRVIAAVRQVVPAGENAALHEPEFRGHEWDYVKSCIDEGWVSSVGSFVGRFEGELVKATGRKFGFACVNGTAALHLALMLMGVRHGDEVLVPALTFVATANAVHHCGAIPHFVDCEHVTLGMCPDALAAYLEKVAARGDDGVCINKQTSRPIRAMVPVHIFGHPARMPELCALAERYGVAVIEDATEALGSTCDGRPVGHHGAIGVLSFNGNKIVTTGGGGALIMDDAELAQRARHIGTTAKVQHARAFLHDEVGYNYRLPNINAALGCAQLERLPDFVARKRLLAQAYEQAFAEIPELKFFRERPGTASNYWLNAIVLVPGSEASRDILLERLNESGLHCRPTWQPMHLLPFQRDCPRAPLPETEDIAARLINLPSSAKLADQLSSSTGR